MITDPRIRNIRKKMTANSQLLAVMNENNNTNPRANITGDTTRKD
jgi:hypothetical protein